MTTRHRRSTSRPHPHRREPEVVPLTALNAGEHGTVVRLSGGHGLLGRMTSLGFTPGADVNVVRNYGRGPLIAQVRGARIALGRGEADRVLVRRSLP